MPADADPVQEQHGNVEPVSAREKRIRVHVQQHSLWQGQLFTERLQFGQEFLAETAIRPGQQGQAPHYCGCMALAMALTVAGGTSPTTVMR